MDLLNRNYPTAEADYGAKIGEVSRRLETTLEQNLQARINQAQKQLDHLLGVQKRLQEGTPELLKARIEDLAEAMRF